MSGLLEKWRELDERLFYADICVKENYIVGAVLGLETREWMEQAAARIRELETERDSAWNGALENAIDVVSDVIIDGSLMDEIAAAIRKLKREARE